MKQLKGKVALVTGGSRGIGEHIAQHLAAEGMNLALVARSLEGLEGVKKKLAPTGVKVLCVSADLTNHESLAAAVKRVEEEFGGIDVLVNNAGVDQFVPFGTMQLDDLTQMIELNLHAPMMLSRLVLPGMQQRGEGHIVNISSLAGLSGVAFAESYSATKHAMVGFTRSLRSSAAASGSGVSASVVCPGFISDEGMFARHVESHGVKPPVFLSSSTPQMVAKSVVRALRKDLPEVIVNPGAPRILLALSLLFPRLGEWIVTRLGVHNVPKAIAGNG